MSWKIAKTLTKASASAMLKIKNTVVISEQQHILPKHRNRPPYEEGVRSCYVASHEKVYPSAQVALVVAKFFHWPRSVSFFSLNKK